MLKLCKQAVTPLKKAAQLTSITKSANTLLTLKIIVADTQIGQLSRALGRTQPWIASWFHWKVPKPVVVPYSRGLDGIKTNKMSLARYLCVGSPGSRLNIKGCRAWRLFVE